MHAVAKQIRSFCEEFDRTLFVQGEGYSRSELTRYFSSSKNGVLLGTDSYWTGVDIPGDALTHVIITRLPFENPNHPVLQARGEWLTKQGKHAFAYMTLPDAIQNFGKELADSFDLILTGHNNDT